MPETREIRKIVNRKTGFGGNNHAAKFNAPADQNMLENDVSACKQTCHTHTCFALKERGCRIV